MINGVDGYISLMQQLEYFQKPKEDEEKQKMA